MQYAVYGKIHDAHTQYTNVKNETRWQRTMHYFYITANTGGGITHSRCGMRPNNEFHFTPIWTIIKAKSKLCCWYNNAATQFSKQPNYIWFRCTPYFVWYGDNKYIAMHFLGGSTLEDKRNNAPRNIEHIEILKCWHILNNSELEIFSFPFPICSIHLWNDKFNLEHLNQS